MDRYYKPKDIINRCSIIKIIGEGRYGIVYLAKNKQGEKVVIKQLKKDMLKRTRKKLFYEQKILEQLNSSKFPKFISKFKNKWSEGYILEYIEGSVFEDILARDEYEFSKDEIYKICDELLDIVDILYESNIVHRDIRLPNVILKKNNELALIDFGLARFIDEEEYVKEIDYWFIGDFLIHLYYSSYIPTGSEERPWFEELDLNDEEKILLKRLMSIDKSYKSTKEIREQLNKIKNKK